MTTKGKIIVVSVPLALLLIWEGGRPPVRTTSPRNACINNLRFLDGTKQEWALEHKKTNGPVALDDVLPYYKIEWRAGMLHCPAGGTYTLGSVGEKPRCSVAGH